MNKKRILMFILRICSIITILILVGMGASILIPLIDNIILIFLLCIWIVTSFFITIVLNYSKEESFGDDSIE